MWNPNGNCYNCGETTASADLDKGRLVYFSRPFALFCMACCRLITLDWRAAKRVLGRPLGVEEQAGPEE